MTHTPYFARGFSSLTVKKGESENLGGEILFTCSIQFAQEILPAEVGPETEVTLSCCVPHAFRLSTAFKDRHIEPTIPLWAIFELMKLQENLWGKEPKEEVLWRTQQQEDSDYFVEHDGNYFVVLDRHGNKVPIVVCFRREEDRDGRRLRLSYTDWFISIVDLSDDEYEQPVNDRFFELVSAN